MTPQVYNKRLALEASMPWAKGLVMDMAYDSKRNEIISAGSHGVQVWYSYADYEGAAAVLRQGGGEHAQLVLFPIHGCS
jgi:hypothetical protein